jgi:chromatin remodeling complex protein RSC6
MASKLLKKFTLVVKPDERLAAVLGTKPLTAPEVRRKLDAYIGRKEMVNEPLTRYLSRVHHTRANLQSMSVIRPDKTLAAIVGGGPYSRSELVERFWDYIKKKKLSNVDQVMAAFFDGKRKVTEEDIRRLTSQVQ